MPIDEAKIVGRTSVYGGWVSLERVELQMPDGVCVERHIEDHGSAVTVLVYSKAQRTALLVSNPRAPVVDAGISPLLEAVAGKIEGDESPESCARREVAEEVGAAITSLDPVACVWSMPSISTERIHLFLGEIDADVALGPGGGVAEEHENIVVHTVKLPALWTLARDGALADLKTLVLVYALRDRHPWLFD